MKKVMFILFLFILLASIVPAQDEGHNVTIYFFRGEGCPHCTAAEPFLEDLKEKYPEVAVEAYETWYNKSNSELFVSMSAACGTKVVGVPTFFIGHKPVIGFDDAQGKGKEIEEEVKKCIVEGCINLMDHLGENLTACPAKESESIVNLPVFGSIDTSKISLPAFTIIIGLLDGFNPCAMWVLLFLLTLLAYTQSRKKMFIVGGTFILVSGIVYYFFMAAWLNLFLFIGFPAYCISGGNYPSFYC